MLMTKIKPDVTSITNIWKHRDGTICFVRKDPDGWWVIVEKHGLVTIQSQVSNSSEAIQTADQWQIQK
jgi:hypothetical protein